MASPLKIFDKKSFLMESCPVKIVQNGTENQIKQLEFDFSRIAIISVHGDPGIFYDFFFILIILIIFNFNQ